jgi:integrase
VVAGKGYSKHGRRWRSLVTDEAGRRTWISFDTEEDAATFVRQRRGERSLNTVLESVGAPKLIGGARKAIIAAFQDEPETPTVAAVGKDLVADRSIRPNTRRLYMGCLKHVLRDEQFANTEIGAVKPGDVRRFFSAVEANRENVKRFLAKIFNAAIREGVISVSPLTQAGIRLPKKNGKLQWGDPRILSADEIEQLCAVCTDRDALAVRLGAYVGLRAGEVGGLRIQDIDLKGCRISIRRNATRGEGGISIGDPKTATSVRTLAVHCSLTQDIDRYVRTHGTGEDGTILLSDQRNPMVAQSLTAILSAACERAQLGRRVTFHDLRHTAAALMIASKVEPKTVQHYLGHATIGMTYDVYGALFPGADEPLAEAMGQLREAAEKARPASPAS